MNIRGEDFRPDGMRGACPYCGEAFETDNRVGGLRDGMVEHYKQKHPERVLQTVAYMDRLDKEIADMFREPN